ncbi:hypothetical protein BC939DRAFT_446968 [Gamsiella multidivaricata]|uniref:uncharacterized protein n=1 Tax=Gamsiella multidivaricata TaxID=101098 RepID=UPI00221EA35B|nr:uncharacterized protein BC939DRAFT_446968 [Gamsiella multidivaricata]KAI7826113.1 hypothetical protein BC939DRAFT_446968 [Gamsiella multidivaricata]
MAMTWQPMGPTLISCIRRRAALASLPSRLAFLLSLSFSLSLETRCASSYSRLNDPLMNDQWMTHGKLPHDQGLVPPSNVLTPHSPATSSLGFNSLSEKQAQEIYSLQYLCVRMLSIDRVQQGYAHKEKRAGD